MSRMYWYRKKWRHYWWITYSNVYSWHTCKIFKSNIILLLHFIIVSIIVGKISKMNSLYYGMLWTLLFSIIINIIIIIIILLIALSILWPNCYTGRVSPLFIPQIGAIFLLFFAVTMWMLSTSLSIWSSKSDPHHHGCLSYMPRAERQFIPPDDI